MPLKSDPIVKMETPVKITLRRPNKSESLPAIGDVIVVRAGFGEPDITHIENIQGAFIGRIPGIQLGQSGAVANKQQDILYRLFDVLVPLCANG